jgi:hypothetical protein
MNDENSANAEQANRPGKRRTWWHPLLVRLLNHLMATAYEVRDEVLVGRMPLRVDMRWNLNLNLSPNLSLNLFLLP